MKKIGVLGSGSWGTALAASINQNGHNVIIYSIDKHVVEDINKNHLNEKYFNSEIHLDEKIKATTDLEDIIECDYIINAIPTQYVRQVLNELSKVLHSPKIFVNASKGIEPGTLKYLHEIFEDELKELMIEYVDLTGPSHAEEVIIGMPTLLVAASEDIDIATDIQKQLSNEKLRIYTSTDVKGVEFGGSVKNVLAIGAGVLSGLGYGDNTRAAFLTRAMREMIIIGQTQGISAETIYGLTGLGDLIVTATSQHSRNFQFGVELSKGKSAEEIEKEMIMVAEGVRSAEAINQIIEKYEICAPIFQTISQVVSGKFSGEEIIELMTRELKGE